MHPNEKCQTYHVEQHVAGVVVEDGRAAVALRRLAPLVEAHRVLEVPACDIIHMGDVSDVTKHSVSMLSIKREHAMIPGR
jgi:hypothetical protein